MKTKIYSVFAVLSLSLSAWSQGVGINETGAAPHTSAGLDVDFNNKGFLLPRMTTGQVNALVNPAKGLMVYNTSVSCLVVNDGTPTIPNWRCISNNAGIPMGTVETINCSGAIVDGAVVVAFATNANFEIPYTGGNGGIHPGQTVTSTGVSGLTATLPGGSFVSDNGNLIYTISGIPSQSGTANFLINIGGKSCSLNVIAYSTAVPNVCNTLNPTVVIDVVNPATGKTWMDRNLGAIRKSVTSIQDPKTYGNLYQWGRGSDGHQCVNRFTGDGVTTSGTTSTLSSSNTPNHGNFITTSGSVNDWRSPQSNSLWQGVNGTNNPCPSGYRLPTETELNAERASYPDDGLYGSFDSPLKMPLAGQRALQGNLAFVNAHAYYWSSTVSGTSARALTIHNSDSVLLYERARGFSVRCIKN
jgi:hypothetical protein